MGLCQGKSAPIEPSNGPAPVRQTAGATAGGAKMSASEMCLTDDQINKWISVERESYSKRTWSDPNCSRE